MPKKTNHEKQGGKIISTLNFPLFFILFSRQWPGPAPPIFFYQPHLPFSFPSGKMKKKKDVGWKRYGGAGLWRPEFFYTLALIIHFSI